MLKKPTNKQTTGVASKAPREHIYPKTNNKMIFLNTKESSKKWHLIDAEGQIVGKLAVVIADLLRGKHKPSYSPNADGGDYVVVINSDKIIFTGKKEITKNYYSHSGYPGGLKTTNPKTLRKSNKSERIITYAVKGMFAHHSPMARKRMTNLHVFAGAEHPHAGQKPVPFALTPKTARLKNVSAKVI